MILADYHMHSSNSGDSKTPMELMIQSAIDKGLSEICFTEHMDMDFPLLPELPEDPFLLDVEAYKKEFLINKEKYSDKINLKFGIEIGMQPQVADENAALAAAHDFDFIIASEHLVDKMDPYYMTFWESQPSVKAGILRYFEQTYENLKLFSDYDVLGHLDYIARYVPKGDTTYSYDAFREIIDEILIHIVRSDKGLDLNSKALGGPTPMSNPCPEILERYREFGGRIITFGADAHVPEGVALCFDKLREIALSAGFTEYYTFDRRRPVTNKL